LTVVTSDSIGLQESVGISGDRQSAIELARRAQPPTPFGPSVDDDDFRLYQAQQLTRKPSHQEPLKKEITHSVHHSHSRLSMGL